MPKVALSTGCKHAEHAALPHLSSRTEKQFSANSWRWPLHCLDTYLGKKGVIQMYLDTPYLGQNGSISICGFEAAAQYYFGSSG